MNTTSSSFVYALIVYTVLYIMFVALTIWREYDDLMAMYNNDREEFTFQMVLTLCINIIALVMGILYTTPVTRRSPVTRIVSLIVIVLLLLVSMLMTAALVNEYRKSSLPLSKSTFITFIISKDLGGMYGRFYMLFHYGIAPLIVVAACIHYLVVYKTFKRLS